MFVYLDESGDTGFRFRQGSSRFFVITLMLVHDPLPIHQAIDDLRTGLGMDRNSEFKWYRSYEETRWAFLRMLRRQDFTARAMVIDKSMMARVQASPVEAFYNVLVQMILKHDEGVIFDATLILDESVQSKRSKQALTTYLRKSLNENPEARKIKAVRYHKSHSDNIIQAVDMLPGAIYAKYRRDKVEYLEFVKMKIGDLWEWAPETQ